MSRALLLEDIPTVRKVMTTILERSDYHVSTADTVAAAKRLVAELEVIDVAVLDIELPDGMGFEVVPLLRDRHGECRVLMVTGRPSSEVATRATELGVDILYKPFSVEDLLQALK